MFHLFALSIKAKQKQGPKQSAMKAAGVPVSLHPRAHFTDQLLPVQWVFLASIQPVYADLFYPIFYQRHVSALYLVGPLLLYQASLRHAFFVKTNVVVHDGVWTFKMYEGNFFLNFHRRTSPPCLLVLPSNVECISSMTLRVKVLVVLAVSREKIQL